MNNDQDINREPLPGYKLIEKIGAGGYGEVWRAEAPGGLDKAIKFIFGAEHEKRATGERKALERIKELRHPFLLSLERIEVIDGRLVVVTELADSSLKDCFDQYRQEGKLGIPREDLQSYLRDAADALDFMFQTLDLQHLDIKPENLLLIGNHVKVADFGLVKDVLQSQASIIGGMTPLYSAPEVFRGQPSSRSDQYSLAILYQEMLTGLLPFAGLTAAELTLQHLNEEPNLSGLNGGERYVVSRALSKDPEHRYDSCREFVDAIVKACAESASGPVSPAPARRATSPESLSSPGQDIRATEVFDDDIPQVDVRPMLIELPDADNTAVRELPGTAFDASTFQPGSTVFIGVGRTGGNILRHLRRQIAEQYGDMAKVPMCRMLVLDSNPTDLTELAQGGAQGISQHETVALPLRRPQHYRDNASRLLKWLSRRWLYNIPKSMRTEGLRPLGRLALVDNARQACGQIRQALADATDGESLRASQEVLGVPVAGNHCRVYIVGSISGGTCGGMVLDLAYAVRAALQRLEITDSQVLAVLTHSTSRDQHFGELARVNAYSWLNEYQHFLNPSVAYPGDGSCGLPAHEAGVKPFDECYLVRLGDNLSTEAYQQAADSVATYLNLDTFSPAHAFFAACRKSEGQSAGPTLRSFGVHRVSAVPSGLAETFASKVCEALLKSWHDEDANRLQEAVDEGTAQLTSQLKLDTGRLAAQCRGLLAASLDGEETSFLEQYLATKAGAGQLSEAQATAAVDQLFRRAEEGRELDGSLIVNNRPLSEIVAPLEEALRAGVRGWLESRIDDTRLRLSGSRKSLDWLNERLQAIQAELSKLGSAVAGRVVELRRASMAGEPDSETPTQPTGVGVLQYLQMRLDHCGLIAAEHLCRVLLADTKDDHDRLNMFGRELQQMARCWQNEPLTEGSAAANNQSRAEEFLRERMPEVCAGLDNRLQAEFINQQGGLYEMVMGGGRVRAQFMAKIRDFAQDQVRSVLGGLKVMDGQLDSADGDELRSHVASAMPRLMEYGGAHRTLAVLPAGTDPASAQQVAQALGGGASAVVGIDNSFSVCVEAQQLPLAQVAVNLIQRRRDYLEFAERVHTRSDIKWSKLIDSAQPRDLEFAAAGWPESSSLNSPHTPQVV